MIPQIIETCRECRIWQSPAPSITPAVILITKQNDTIQADILFYKKHMAWHMIDVADRWHASVELLSKASPAICEAICTCWLSIFGPFKFLVVDGERGLITDEAVQYLKQHGITIKTKAPNQHANVIERRGAILRHAMHCIEDQLTKENIPITFKQLLGEATFSGNALITHNGASPYNARMGTQPAMLPDIHALPETTAVGPARFTHRIREISLQHIIESSALGRINRALRSHTTTAGEAADYKPGELIDIHRPPNNKDTSGWHGPATVIRNVPDEGQVVAKLNNHEVRARYPDCRRWMDFVNLVYNTTEDVYTTTGQAVALMINRIKALEPGKFITVGFHKLTTSNNWVRTQATSAHSALALSAQHVSHNILGYPNTFAIRIGKGIQRFPACSEADYTVLVYWNRSFDHAQMYEADGNGQITTKQLIGDSFAEMLYLQLLCTRNTDSPVDIKDITIPTTDDNDDDNISNAASASDIQRRDPDQLSTITEEDDLDLDALAHEAYFNINDETYDITATVADRHVDDTITVKGASTTLRPERTPAL